MELIEGKRRSKFNGTSSENVFGHCNPEIGVRAVCSMNLVGKEKFPDRSKAASNNQRKKARNCDLYITIHFYEANGNLACLRSYLSWRSNAVYRTT